MRTASLMMFLFVLVLSACKENTADEHAHDHGHQGLEPLAYTLYSEKIELFVEFKPLVKGIESKFAAHFTILGEYFIPLTEGKVTVSLIIGEKGIRQSSDQASSPGIFRLSLSPTAAGKGKLVFDIEGPDFIDQIVIDNITVYENEHDAIQDQVESTTGSDISYLKEQAWKVEFANSLVTKQSFHEVLKTDGQILSAPGDEMFVTANSSGNVLFSGNNTIIGTELNAGSQLFSISGGNISEDNVESKYKSAKINYEKAKADYERAGILVKEKIVSEKDFLNYKTAFENAQIVFSSLSESYAGKAQIISSPMSGFVKNILVTEGQYVEAGTPLAVISKNQKLILQANISQRYFNKLPAIESANFRLSGSSEIFDTKSLNGKLISFGKSVSAQSPFIPLSFEINNVGSIIPGSVAEVFLKTSPINDALVIPVSALIEEQGVFFVYVQTGAESFQKREVKLGMDDGMNVHLLSGVQEGERVVSKGANQIKLSSASGSLPAHGHEH